MLLYDAHPIIANQNARFHKSIAYVVTHQAVHTFMFDGSPVSSVLGRTVAAALCKSLSYRSFFYPPFLQQHAHSVQKLRAYQFSEKNVELQVCGFCPAYSVDTLQASGSLSTLVLAVLEFEKRWINHATHTRRQPRNRYKKNLPHFSLAFSPSCP
jgi:hypothetical protein